MSAALLIFLSRALPSSPHSHPYLVFPVASGGLKSTFSPVEVVLYNAGASV